MDIGGYGSRIAFAALPCPGRRGFCTRVPDSISNSQFQIRLRVLAAQGARVVQNRSPSKQRAQGMPGAAAPIASRANEKHTSVITTGSDGSLRHSPRNGFTAYFVLSPARSGLFVTVILRLLGADLTPASRRQNHTTSPSASAPFVTCAARVHRIPPRVRDVRNAPLWDRTVIDIEVIWVRRKLKYFCKRGWTSHFGKHEVICPSGKISSPMEPTVPRMRA